MELTLRIANEQDAIALVHLQQRIVRESLREDYPDDVLKCFSSQITVERFLKYRDAGMRLLAERDGALLGFGTLFFDGRIGGLYVDASHQGQGVGSALLSALEADARERGFAQLELQSTLTAESFYLSRGYQARPRIVHNLSQTPRIGMTVVPMIKVLTR